MLLTCLEEGRKENMSLVEPTLTQHQSTLHQVNASPFALILPRFSIKLPLCLICLLHQQTSFFFFFWPVDFPQLFHLFQRYLGIMTGDNNAPPWETNRWCHCFTAITLCSQHSQSQSTKVVHCQFKFVTSVSYRTWTEFYFNPTIQPILLPMWPRHPFSMVHHLTSSVTAPIIITTTTRATPSNSRGVWLRGRAGV